MTDPTKKTISSFTGSRVANKLRSDQQLIAPPDAPEQGDGTAEVKLHPEIAKIIPATVTSYMGAIPYEKFKEYYASVYDQVRAGNHLVSGRVLFDTKIGKTDISIRTLKKREASFIQAVAMSFDSTDFIKSYPLLDIYQMIFGVSRIGEVTIPENKNNLDNYKEWSDSDTIKQLISFFQNMDNEFAVIIFNILNDVTLAKRYAFLELVPNP